MVTTIQPTTAEVVEATALTAAEFYTLPDHGGRTELVKGEIVPMSPASTYHGVIAMRLAGHLWKHVVAEKVGEVYAAETGFTIHQDPDTVRAPDVAFVARERIPAEGIPESGFWAIAPDLVAEVISPNDQMPAVQQKVLDYLTAGVRLVWLVEPATRTVTVYRSLDDVQILREDGTLAGGEVLPAFVLPLAELFA